MMHAGHGGCRNYGRVRGITSIRDIIYIREAIGVSKFARGTTDILARPTTSRPSPHARRSHTRTAGNYGPSDDNGEWRQPRGHLP